MLRRTQLRQRGARTIRWEKWEGSTRQEVRRHAEYRCQGCGKPDSSGDPFERHHAFGRAGTGARLGDDFCHHPALGVWLCRSYRGQLGCHERVQNGGDAALEDRLQRHAYAEFAAEFDRSPRVPRGYTPTQAIRRLVTLLENKGWHYDERTNGLVRGWAA